MSAELTAFLQINNIALCGKSFSYIAHDIKTVLEYIATNEKLFLKTPNTVLKKRHLPCYYVSTVLTSLREWLQQCLMVKHSKDITRSILCIFHFLYFDPKWELSVLCNHSLANKRLGSHTGNKTKLMETPGPTCSKIVTLTKTAKAPQIFFGKKGSVYTYDTFENLMSR